MDLSSLRVEYETKGLSEIDCDSNPIIQFGKWIKQAIDAELIEPNAMILSTVDLQNQPRSRHVLLKKFDDNGFLFYTNFRSDKSIHIQSNPKVALTFSWLGLHRQVNITGNVIEGEPSEADRYWQTRSRDSQLGSAVSKQSKRLSSREELELSYASLSKELDSKQVARPAHWGGWLVVPETIEFWQGRANRLHDRIKYEHTDEDWIIERLWP